MKLIGQNQKLTSRKLIFLTSLFMVILFILQIINFNRFATWGEKLKRLENEAEALKEKNENLKKEITKKSTLSVVKNQAEKLDFTKVSSYLYLTPQVPVALK
jgi:cell division protein FtsL